LAVVLIHASFVLSSEISHCTLIVIIFKMSFVCLQFVDEKVQWLHIDMAGPVWNDKKRAATGFGVSTLVEWVLSNST
jgi:Cytosol aminopeptidase family, catalytic domain